MTFYLIIQIKSHCSVSVLFIVTGTFTVICPAAGAVAIVTDDATMTSLSVACCCKVLPCRHVIVLSFLLLLTSSRIGQLGLE